MAAFLLDNFTDTDGDELSLAHTPDVGAAWFKAAGGGGNHLVIDDRGGGVFYCLRNNAAASTWVRYVSTQAPPSADYYAEAVVRPLTVLQYAALGVRIDGTYANGYEVWFTNTGILLVRENSGTPTTLVTQAFTWTAGTDYLVRLEVAGTGATVTLTLKIDGATIATFSDTSGSRITAAGSVGIAGFDGSTTTGFAFNSVTGDAAVADSLTITKPVAFQTFQRTGTTADIPVAGTNAGATENIEANFNSAGFGNVATAVPAGAFTGSRTTQTNGRGSFIARKATTTTATVTVANVGIGDIFAVGGDSNWEGRLTNAQTYSGAAGASMFRQDDAWAALADPADTGTSGGSPWPLVANQHSADQAVPVAFITAATGSTDLAGSATTWASGGADYNSLIQQVTDSGVNAVKGVLMSLGPNAVVSASTPSQASIESALTAMANGFAGAIAGAPKTMVALFGEVNTGSPPDRRTAIDNYRKAILSRVALGGNVVMGANLIDQNWSDDVHAKTDAEGLLVAKRTWAAMKDAFFGGSIGRGPRLVSATWNVARNQIAVIFDRNLKPALTFGTGAWIVGDAGTPMTLSSIAYHGTNPAGILINTSAAATGGAGTTTLTFASGNDAAGVVVPCTTDITPPTGTAFQIPAEPIYAAAVSEAAAPDTTAPTLTGTLTASSITQTSYTLSWPAGSDNVAVTSYERSLDGGGTWLDVGNVTTLNVTGRTAGSTDACRVRAKDAAGNVSTPALAASVNLLPVPTVTVTLTTNGTAPAGSLTGLKWAWFDQVTPDLFGAPTDKGSAETTDSSGVLTISLPNSSKTSGQVGWLDVTNSDGNPATQHKFFGGPAAVN